MSSWSSSWRGLRLCWSIVSGLFCGHISDEHAVWGLASWNLQNGRTAGIPASWAPPGTLPRCDRALGKCSATMEARCLARAGSCTVSKHLHPRSLKNMKLGAHSHGKWDLIPECDALSVFKYLEELQDQHSAGKFTTEINLVRTQTGLPTKGSYN